MKRIARTFKKVKTGLKKVVKTIRRHSKHVRIPKFVINAAKRSKTGWLKLPFKGRVAICSVLGIIGLGLIAVPIYLKVEFAMRPSILSASVFNEQEGVLPEEYIYLFLTKSVNPKKFEQKLEEENDLELEIIENREQSSFGFRKKGGWDPNGRYSIDVDAETLVKNGFSISFSIVKSPKVDLTNIGQQISEKHQFLVAFNQPVFDSEYNTDAELPDLLNFTPELQGTTELLSPSVIRFSPKKQLAEKSYKLIVDHELVKNEHGINMKKDAEYSFVVVKDTDAESPENNSSNFIYDIFPAVRINTKDPLYVLVNHEVDKASFESAIRLKVGESSMQTNVDWALVTREYLEERYEYTVPLYENPEKSYVVTIIPETEWGEEEHVIYFEKGVKKLSGQTLTYDYYEDIQVVTPLRYISTNTISDDSNYSYPEFTFNNTLKYNDETIDKLVAITDENGKTFSVEISFSHGFNSGNENTKISLDGDFEKENRYTVTFSKELEDVYGYSLDKDLDVAFTYRGTAGRISIPFVSFFGSETAFIDNSENTKLLLQSRGIKKIQTELKRISPQDLIATLAENDVEKATQRIFNMGTTQKNWTKDFSDVGEETLKYEALQFQYELGKLKNGIYIATVQDAGRSTRDYRIMIVSTNTVVIKKSASDKAVLAWVVSATSGDPVGGKPLNLVCEDSDQTYSEKTDKQGVANFTNVDCPSSLYVFSDDGSVFSSSGYSRYLYEDNFLDYNQYGIQENIAAFAYTDKPIYKLGDTVNLKTFLRKRESDKFVSFSEDFLIEIFNEQGTAIHSETLTANDFGTASTSFELPKDIRTGTYSVGINEKKLSNFQVEEYQPHNFNFSVSTQDEEILKTKDTIELEVNASYYFGQPLENANVEVAVYVRESNALYYSIPEALSEFNFRSYGYSDPEYVNYSSKKIWSSKEKIGNNGTLELSIPYSIPDEVFEYSPKVLSIEVKLTDSLGDTEYKTIYKYVAPKNGLIGIDSESYYLSAQEEYSAKIVLLDEELKPEPYEKIKIQVIRTEVIQELHKQINGVSFWKNKVLEYPERTVYLTTDSDGLVDFSYLPRMDDADYTLIVSRTRDSNVQNFVYFNSFGVWGYQYSDNFDQTQIDLTLDKEEYEVGDTARVTPQLSSNHDLALVTYERQGVLSYEIVDLVKDTPISIDITSSMQPNFFVSVFALQTHKRDCQFLDFKMGIQEILVGTADKRLETEASTDKPKYNPGEKVTLTVETDLNGNPEQLEYMVAVVDKAVIDIAKITDEEPLEEQLINALWANWDLNVDTSSNITIYENRLIEETEWGNKGGDEGSFLESLEEEDLRNKFYDVAYWLPSRISEDGKLEVSFTAPDNLTTWQVVVIGTTKDSKIATDTIELIVSKDVNITANIPESLYESDITELLFNATFSDEVEALVGKDKIVTEILVENGKIDCDGKRNTSCVKSIDLNGVPIAYNFYPEAPGEAKVKFGIAYKDTVYDTLEKSIEVKSTYTHKEDIIYGNTFTSPETKYSFPEAESLKGQEITILLLDDPIGDLGHLEDFFLDYKNLCSEQISSKILALLPYADQHEEAHKSIDLGVERLIRMQNSDGGWGIWTNNKSLNYNTVYTYFALLQAKHSGFEVSQETLERANNFIADNIYVYDELAPFVWAVLAEEDTFDISGVNSYFSSQLDFDSRVIDRAYVAYVYYRYLNSDQISRGEKSLVRGRVEELSNDLLDDLEISNQKGLWKEPRKLSGYYYYNDTRTTAIVLDILLEVADTDERFIPAINYLTEMSKDDALGTHTGYFVFKALSAAKGKLNTSLDAEKITVELNGQTLTNKENVENGVKYAVSPDPSRKNVSVNVNTPKNTLVNYQIIIGYDIKISDQEASDNELSMFMEYKDLEGNTTDNFQWGHVYEATTTLFVYEDLTQSEIHIPVAAGFSPINFNLDLTSEQLLQFQEDQDTLPSFSFVNMDIRKDEVVFYTGDHLYSNELTPGIYNFTFYVRATNRGEYSNPGVWAQEMYLPGKSCSQKAASYVIK